MPSTRPGTARPNQAQDSDGLPGERAASEEERDVSAPDTDAEHETGSRAAEDGTMASADGDKVGPGPGIPQGGSVANQGGRDRG